MMIKKIHFDIYDVTVLMISALLLVLGSVCFLLQEFQLLTISMIFIHVILLVKFLKNSPILLILLFSLLHALVYFDFFILNRAISFWKDFQDENFLSKTLYSHFLFIFIFGNIISHFELVNSKRFDFKTIFSGNSLVFTLLSVIGVIIIFFGITGETIASGSYANGNQVKSPFFEYFILIYFLLLIFAKNKKSHNAVLVILFICYVLKSLLYGGRIEVLQLCLLLFLILVDLKKNISRYRLVVVLFCLFYFNSIIGVIRSNPFVIYEPNFTEIFNPLNTLKQNTSLNSISSTEGDVVQASARMIGLVEINEITVQQRFLGFFYFIFSGFIPSSYLPDYVSLASYKQTLYESGGGGLISSYFFVWFGYFGPILSALFLGLVINYFYIYRFESKILFVYGFCLLTTFPRWHSYNPILIVKFSLYGVVAYYLISYFLDLSKYLIKNSLPTILKKN